MFFSQSSLHWEVNALSWTAVFCCTLFTHLFINLFVRNVWMGVRSKVNGRAWGHDPRPPLKKSRGAAHLMEFPLPVDGLYSFVVFQSNPLHPANGQHESEISLYLDFCKNNMITVENPDWKKKIEIGFFFLFFFWRDRWNNVVDPNPGYPNLEGCWEEISIEKREEPRLKKKNSNQIIFSFFLEGSMKQCCWSESWVSEFREVLRGDQHRDKGGTQIEKKKKFKSDLFFFLRHRWNNVVDSNPGHPNSQDEGSSLLLRSTDQTDPIRSHHSLFFSFHQEITFYEAHGAPEIRVILNGLELS